MTFSNKPIDIQVLRLRTNKKVGERNAVIQRTGSKSTPIPEAWEWYAKTLVCTHAGKFKPRGKGKRARQESRSIECPTQPNAGDANRKFREANQVANAITSTMSSLGM
ncbi:hypothetical protein PInf_009983 [Phytophthora infestans]|nr:hypothetical protein PInf_009983 [Phytophthora infestans]